MSQISRSYPFSQDVRSEMIKILSMGPSSNLTYRYVEVVIEIVDIYLKRYEYIQIHVESLRLP